MESLRIKFKTADLLAFTAIIGYLCCLIFLSGNYSDGIQIIDTHDEVKINYNIQQNGFVHALKEEINYRLTHRFLPAYSFIRVVKVYFWGENWSAYYLYNLVLGIIGSCALYWFGRLINLSVFGALLFAFLTYIGFESWFNQATIIYRIANAELPGLVFLGVGLIAMVYSAKRKNTLNGFEAVFIATLLINTVIKENFIVLVPALAFWKVWLYSTYQNISFVSSAKKHLVQALIVSVVIGIELIIIVFYIGTNKMSYVGVSSNLGQIISTIKTFKNFLNEEGTIPLLYSTLCIALAIYAGNSLPDDRLKSIKQLVTEYWYYVVLAVLIVFPQIVTYATAGIYERYKMPLIIGITFLIAALVSYIYRSPKRFFIVKACLGIFLLLIFYRNTVNAFANAKSYAEDKNLTAKIFSMIPSATNEKILIIADPVLQWETDISIVKFLTYSKNCSNVNVASVSINQNDRLFTIKTEENYEHLVRTHEEEIGEYYLREPDTVGFKYVIYLMPEFKDVYLSKQTWYNNPHDSIAWMNGALLIY